MIGYFCIYLVRTFKIFKIIKMKVNWKIEIVSIILLIIQFIVALTGKYYIIQIFILIFLFINYQTYISKIIFF